MSNLLKLENLNYYLKPAEQYTRSKNQEAPCTVKCPPKAGFAAGSNRTYSKEIQKQKKKDKNEEKNKLSHKSKN